MLINKCYFELQLRLHKQTDRDEFKEFFIIYSVKIKAVLQFILFNCIFFSLLDPGAISGKLHVDTQRLFYMTILRDNTTTVLKLALWEIKIQENILCTGRCKSSIISSAPKWTIKLYCQTL